MLTPDVLDVLVLPLGEKTKDEMRKTARSMGLPASERVESQEICFVEDRDYPRFISIITGAEEEPGPVLDEKGNAVGTHRGIHHYTVGQRKGLGIASPTPLYVTKIDAENNAVHVGPRDAAMSREFTVNEIN